MWHWAFLAISSALLDTLGAPLKMTKQHWDSYMFSVQREEIDPDIL